MGFVRILHAPVERPTLPHVEHLGVMTIAWGTYAVEMFEPDWDETIDVSFVWAIVVVFDNPHYVNVLVNYLRSYQIMPSRIAQEYMERLVERVVPEIRHKAMVIVVAPDDAIMRFLFGDIDAVARYLVIVVEEEIPSIEEAIRICKQTYCRDEEGEGELLYCIIEECIPRTPELQTPRVIEIHVSLYGRYYKGCHAFWLVKDWLPEKEYIQLSARCPGA